MIILGKITQEKAKILKWMVISLLGILIFSIAACLVYSYLGNGLKDLFDNNSGSYFLGRVVSNWEENPFKYCFDKVTDIFFSYLPCSLMAILFFSLAYLFYRQNKFNYAVLFIVLGGLSLRVFSGMNFYLHQWDESIHALVAKNLIKNPFVPVLYSNPVLGYEYIDWNMNYIWLHKPPMALWLMMLSMKIFGINEIAVRLPAIMLSTMSLFLTYYIGSYFFNRKVGVLATFFQSINYFIILIAAGVYPTGSVDTVFLFFFELGIFFSILQIKRKNSNFILLIGLTMGLAILTKRMFGLMLIPVWLSLIAGKECWRKIFIKFLLLILISLAVFLPWQLYINQTFPKEAAWESKYDLIHVFQGVEEHGESILFHIKRMAKIFGAGIYIAIVWFILVFRRRKDFKLFVVLVWLAVPYLVFSLVATKMPSYIIMSSPAVFLIQSYLILFLVERHHKRKDENNKVFLDQKALSIAIIIVLFVLPIESNLNFLGYNKFFENSEWAQEFREIDRKLKDGKYVIFNCHRPIEAMFYSSHLAYDKIPTSYDIQSVREKGYKIAIYNQENELPKYIKKDKEIVILKEIKQYNLNAWSVDSRYKGY